MRETAVESHSFRKVREKGWGTRPPSFEVAGRGRPVLHQTALETEAPFEFEYATRQPGCRRTEQRVRGRHSTTRIANCCRNAPEAEWGQVELIENVVGGHAQLDLGTFSDEFHRGQPEFLRDSEVDVLIARASERVASNPRTFRQAWVATGRLEGEVTGRAVGKIPSGGG